jgi:hypothetical protein
VKPKSNLSRHGAATALSTTSYNTINIELEKVNRQLGTLMSQLPVPVQEVIVKKRKQSGGKKGTKEKKSKSLRRTPLQVISQAAPHSVAAAFNNSQ